MKRLLLAIVLVYGMCGLVQAESVDSLTAKNVAVAFLTQVNNKVNLDLKLIYQTNMLNNKPRKDDSENQTLFYVFANGFNEGFIIIAGDDNSRPVLGYANSGIFDTNSLPPNFRKWIESYKKELRNIIAKNIIAPESIQEQWKDLKNGTKLKAETSKSAGPLMSTTWSQSPYYNALCPGGSVTGCVATAQAQIMKYWNYPDVGQGFHSYYENDYGYLSADFGATTYDWGSMPDHVTGPNNAVATLMYHCGVSVEMNYSPEGSSAYVIDSWLHPHNSENAYTEYFGYDNSVEGIKRENYSTYAWKQILRNELDAGRPINYCGCGASGGHAFVCDGYNSSGFFHFNWGWGGTCDGYFLVDELNPGSSNYTNGQQAIIGIKPPSGALTYNMVLYNNVSLSSNIIYYGQAFSVSTNIWNNGLNDFAGDYCAAVFDASSNFVDYVEIMTDWSLEAGYTYSNDIVFSSTGMIGLLPGDYSIYIYYRPTGGNWVPVSDYGGYTNSAQLRVINPNDIELNSVIALTPGTELINGQSASVNFNIVNDGSSSFYGTYSVDLYGLDGYWVENIGSYTESTGLPPGYTYSYPYITLNTSVITADPDMYFLVVTHKWNGGNYQITGSTYNNNPIYVTVKNPIIVADMFESNDTEDDAFEFYANFSNNFAQILTYGSNNHIGSDLDYYEVDLEEGYNYEVTVRVHDSYNSGNGNDYTNDVLWSYSLDNIWSEPYDDVMGSDINIYDGGKVKFLVAPYFQGSVGTYLLDIKIKRFLNTGVPDEKAENSFCVYPNPVKDYLNISNGNNDLIHTVQIRDITGKTVMNNRYENTQELIQVQVENLSVGVYTVIIETRDDIEQFKFIKSE